MKKNEKKTKKFELKSSKKINTLEKKPQKGGTPAIENKETTRIFVKVFVDPKSLKVYNVFTLLFVSCNNVIKITNKAKL